MARYFTRITKGIVLILIGGIITMLWLHYAPGPAGRMMEYIIYGIAGGLFIITALSPITGLALLSFLTPTISAIPLYYTGGYTYPILIFTGAGFICGWLAHEIIRGDTVPFFRGQGWLYLLLIVVLIATAASFTRYYPSWLWEAPAYLAQKVNVKNMTRLEATRYIVFDAANILVGIGMILAVYRILYRRHARGKGGVDLVVWMFLLGGIAAAAVAIYQGHTNVRFLANASYYWIRLKRANGTCSDPNALGTLLGLCISISIMKLFFPGSWEGVRQFLSRIIMGITVGCVWLARLIFRRKAAPENRKQEAGNTGTITVLEKASGLFWGIFPRVLCLAAILIYGLAIWYSGSRSGFLAIVLSIGGTAFVTLVVLDKLLRKIRVPTAVRAVVFIGCIVIGIASVYAIPWVVDTMDNKIAITSDSSSLARRLKRDFRKYRQQNGLKGVLNDPRRRRYWKYAEIMLKDQPVTGVGQGAYVVELMNYARAEGEELHREDNACNYYLHHSAELGIPGIAALLLLYGTLLAGFIRIGRRWYALERAEHHRILSQIVPYTIFLIILIFGVHTFAQEVNIGWSIVVGVIAATQMRIIGPRTRNRMLLRYGGTALLSIIIAFYAWQVMRVNREGRMNTERRLAMFGIGGELGWYNWERWSGVPFRHRWMGKQASMTVPRKNLILGIPIVSNDPTISNNPQKVTFYLDGIIAKEYMLRTPGKWELISFPAPYADPFIRNIKPQVTVRITVDRTWVPLDTTGEKDVRELGIVVGEFRWREPKGMMEGWYKPEVWEGSIPYRWSTGYAWRKIVTSTNHYIEIPMYASNLLLSRWPVDAALYLNSEYLSTVTFNTKRWKNYTFPLPEDIKPNSTNILEIIPSRTWVPKHYGFDDKRELGIAVGEITLE